MAALFGATAATDAFVAASSVPQIVYDLLVGGAIRAALVPIFVDAVKDEERLWRLLNTVLTLVVLMLAAVALVLGIFAPTVVALLAGGFGEETRAAAVPMVRLMLVAVVLQGTGRRHHRRALRAPAGDVAGLRSGGLQRWRHRGGAVAPPEARRLRAGARRGTWSGRPGDPATARGSGGCATGLPLSLTARKFGPCCGCTRRSRSGMIVTIVGIVIDRNLASRLAEGSLSVMNYATRLIQFPLGPGRHGDLVRGAGTPLSEHASALAAARSESGPGSAPTLTGAYTKALDGYRETLRFGVRIVLLLMLPATFALMALREPLVQLLFEHGRFGGADTARTALVFLAYAPQLPFTALDQLLIVAFYARKDTRTPVLVGVGTVLLYLVSALAMIQPFGVAGLALANAIQNSAHGIILLVLLERAGSGVLDRGFVLWTLRVAVAAAMLGLLLWLAAGWAFANVTSVLLLAALLVACGAVGGLVYLMLLEALGVRDLRSVVMVFVRRVRPAA